MNLKWNQIGVAFLVGLLIGTLLGGSRLRRYFSHRGDRPPSHERMVKVFSNKLNLNEDQTKQVGAILETKRTKLNAVMTEMKEKLAAVRKETGDEIRSILTPEQQPKFDDFDKKMQQRFKKRLPDPRKHD